MIFSCSPGERTAPRRVVGEQSPAYLGRLRQVDGEPAHPAVVDPPELRLQALAEPHHGAARAGPEETPDLTVETQHAQRVPLGHLRPEPLERVVDPVDQLD
ncbi:MAG TPA: hypothetical protein VGD53_14915, partial [Actinoallomurus sp.]